MLRACTQILSLWLPTLPPTPPPPAGGSELLTSCLVPPHFSWPHTRLSATQFHWLPQSGHSLCGCSSMRHFRDLFWLFIGSELCVAKAFESKSRASSKGQGISSKAFLDPEERWNAKGKSLSLVFQISKGGHKDFYHHFDWEFHVGLIVFQNSYH